MKETIFSFIPVVLLIWLMVKKNSMPSCKALPLTATVLYFIALIVFKKDPNLIHAHVAKGLLVAWTPILIIAGAIFLFKTMEYTGGLTTIKQWLNSISENKIAQLMIVGWAFPFLIEGASGFGTPAAIAGPVLVGLGFNPIRVAILTLIMNSVPVSFGAVGTPTWFGFSELNLTDSDTLIIGFKSAVIHSIIALIIPLIALSQLVEWKSIFRNIKYILICIAFTVLPYLIIARYNYEFPSLIGGAIGLIISVVAAKKNIGINKAKVLLKVPMEKLEGSADLSRQGILSGQLIKALFPLWGTIVLLVLTRIGQLGIKNLLLATEPGIALSLGSLGDLKISASMVVGLENIFQTSLNWSHPILYVPSFLPFVFISLLTFLWYNNPLSIFNKLLKSTTIQMKSPTLALLGALVFVNLMMMGGDESAVNHIGLVLAQASGRSWNFFASFMGALGSFFSGSATISNLTFAGIQDSISVTLGLERTTTLALQSVGGALGNMVCINNIVAVCSVLALGNKEGYILKQTVVPMVIYGILAGMLAYFIF
jgi:lactate permease